MRKKMSSQFLSPLKQKQMSEVKYQKENRRKYSIFLITMWEISGSLAIVQMLQESSARVKFRKAPSLPGKQEYK